MIVTGMISFLVGIIICFTLMVVLMLVSFRIERCQNRWLAVNLPELVGPDEIIYDGFSKEFKAYSRHYLFVITLSRHPHVAYVREHYVRWLDHCQLLVSVLFVVLILLFFGMVVFSAATLVLWKEPIIIALLISLPSFLMLIVQQLKAQIRWVNILKKSKDRMAR